MYTKLIGFYPGVVLWTDIIVHHPGAGGEGAMICGDLAAMGKYIQVNVWPQKNRYL